MSEDDRQSKAARAKLMLKKRQQKATNKPGISSPSPPPSRGFTPLPSDLATSSPTTNDGVGDVFGEATHSEVAEWMNSLARVNTPPAPPVLSNVNMPHPNSTRSELQRQPDMTSSLGSEKVLSTAQPDSQGTFALDLREIDSLLQQERVRTKSLSDKVEEQNKAIVTLQAEKKTLLDSLQSSRVAEISRQQAEAQLREKSLKQYDLQVEQLKGSLQETTRKTIEQQQTISLLVSEKTTLTASLERLEAVESRAQELEDLLDAERTRSSSFEVSAKQLEAALGESSTRVTYLSAQEKELQDRCREQERELQLINGSLSELQAESDRYQRMVQELEERIQSDDRVEKLEGILQNTQERVEELQFQLSKTKQAHSTLKSEHDEVCSQLLTRTTAVSAVEEKHADLNRLLSSTQDELSSIRSERDSLLHEKASIVVQAEARNKDISEMQEKLSQAATEFAATSRHLLSMQNELKKANRRADDAERIQGDLQAEGITLMRSVEEMRPKIVELTNIRLELVERIDSLEAVIRRKEDSISLLESSIEEAKEKAIEAEKTRLRENDVRRKDESSSQDNLFRTQKAYAELQAELDALGINLRDREAEREGYHQLALRRLEEIDHLTFSLQAQTERLNSAEKELAERTLAQSEDQGFVEGMQNEIEALRNDLLLKEEEVERLREPSFVLGQSLDGEMVSALKQQQSLELSNARSQIRALESAVFESDARAHTLQKQVSTLMDQLTQMRSLSNVPSRPFSPTPGLPSRPSSRARNVTDDLRRASFNANKRPAIPSPKVQSPLSPPPLSIRRAFDSLSPETRHKRRVSLGMLKARIDSEVASSVKSRPPSRALTPLPEASDIPASPIVGDVMELSEPHHIRGFRRHQFLDESHIFWCNSCHGDLVIL